MMGQWIQQTTTIAHVYLCNKPAQSAHVPQNLMYNNNNFKSKKEKKKEKKSLKKTKEETEWSGSTYTR